MKRLLTIDGFFPKEGHNDNLVEFDEYVSVFDHKKFWTLTRIPNSYSLFDGEDLIGSLGPGKLRLRDREHIAYYNHAYVHRVGNIFTHMALLHAGSKIPFFLLDVVPLHDDKYPIEGLSYLSSFQEARMWTRNKCFFVSDANGAVLGQFLCESRIATKVDRAKGRIHILSSLPDEQRAELLGALFAISTMYATGFLDEFGFA